MAIPEHVKRQAMDAVTNKVTTAQIRLYASNDNAAIFTSPEKTAPAAPGVITDDVKKQAMDAIANKGTMSQIRLVEDKGSLSPIGTVPMGNNPLAEKIARMHEMGQGPDSVHQEMTKDGFGRE